MTTDPAGAVIPEVTRPPARWKLERVSDRRIDLLVSGDPAREPLRFPMSAEELYRLVHEGDRLISWSAPSSEGTFTQPSVTPDEVRQSLSITGYTVTTGSSEAHTRLVQATPWASWVEEVPAAEAGHVAWFVNVFAVDDGAFRQAAAAHGAALAVSATDQGGPAGGR